MSSNHSQHLTIAVDARWIFDRISGVGRVTRGLLRHLPGVDSDVRFLFIFDNEQRMRNVSDECGLNNFGNVETVMFPYDVFSIASQIRLPGFLKRNSVDVFHSTNFMLPLRRCKCRIIVTIHDLIPLIFPEYTPRSKKRKLFGLYKLIMRRIARVADVIIADSENTKRDIVKYFPYAVDKVRVVHCGLEEHYFALPDGPSDFLRKRYDIDGPAIITAGRADPYKNTLGLVRAFEIIVNERKLDAHLVVVGEEDQRYPEVRNYIEESGLSGQVTFTGYLEDEELVRAYASADIMVHPSMYEGFGLPPLEAMAAGTPVVSSNAASLPEVLGDAAVYVEPGDTEGMAKVIVDILSDQKKRGEMIVLGKQQAGRYEWKEVAKQTVRIYEMAVKS